MNKIFSLSTILVAALTLAGCAGEEENIFDQSAAERLNSARELYSARLRAQPNGWAMQLYPTKKDEAPYGSGYLVLMDFNEDNSVVVSMNNELSGNAYISTRSNWDVNTDDGPVLSFDTYNSAMHKFSDPYDVPSTGTKDQRKDETGEGIGGDYEFIIVDAPEDASYMMLKGKKRGTYNLLTPVEQGVEYEAYLEDVNAFHDKMFSASAPSGDFMQIGDSLYHFDGASDHLPSIYLDGKDATLFQTFNPFLITKRGNDYYLRFRDVQTADKDNKEQEFRYNAEKDLFEGTANASNVIRGYDKGRFVAEALDANHKFMLMNGSNISEKLKALYDKFAADFRARGYTLRNIQLVNVQGETSWQLSYSRSGAGNGTSKYNVNVKGDGDNAVIEYVKAADNSSENQINAMPSLKELITALTGSVKISAIDSNFNLTNIKVTSSSDSDIWYTLKYNN